METLTELQRIPKRKSHAFGKDVYLLGEDKNGELLWLEAASWDCGWYWGFGYIERYTSSNPSTAKDINSHTHWDSEIVGKHEIYDAEKQCFRLNGKYVHHFNEYQEIAKTVLTETESWKLAELMQTCYTLKETAEVFGRGGSHLTTNKTEENIVKRPEIAKEINEIILPKLFQEIYSLLS